MPGFFNDFSCANVEIAPFGKNQERCYYGLALNRSAFFLIPHPIDGADDDNRLITPEEDEEAELWGDERDTLHRDSGHLYAVRLASILCSRYVTIEQFVKAVSGPDEPFRWKWLYHLAWPEIESVWFRRDERTWTASIAEYQAVIRRDSDGTYHVEAGKATHGPGSFEGEPVISISELANLQSAISAGCAAWRERFPEEPLPDWWNAQSTSR